MIQKNIMFVNIKERLILRGDMAVAANPHDRPAAGCPHLAGPGGRHAVDGARGPRSRDRPHIRCARPGRFAPPARHLGGAPHPPVSSGAAWVARHRPHHADIALAYPRAARTMAQTMRIAQTTVVCNRTPFSMSQCKNLPRKAGGVRAGAVIRLCISHAYLRTNPHGVIASWYAQDD